ncbi:MAG: alpha/beta hydrolase [Acidimicrobiia bacterium]
MRRVTIDIGGPVSVIEYGGSGPLAVCVHGLEGSAYNWRDIAPDLIRTHTVVAPDLIGFGYTQPSGRAATVSANADLVSGLIDHYGGPALVVGNSMGGLISILAAGNRPASVGAMVLVGPAGPVRRWDRLRPWAALTIGAPLIPGIGAAIVDAYRSSRSAEEGVAESYRLVTADPDTVSPTATADALEIAVLRRTQPWAAHSLVEATRSIFPFVVASRRFTDALDRVAQPTLLIQGLADRIVDRHTAQWIAAKRPDWATAYLEGIGHVPMIESPETFIEVFRAWEGHLGDGDQDARRSSVNGRSS